LGGFTAQARAHALSVLLDAPDVAVPLHPVAQVSVPHAEASVDTGPVGRALASVLWPGAAIANFGSASQLLDQLCGLPPLPCIPVSPDARKILKTVDYPLRAEASYPQGPGDAKLEPSPGTVMESHAAEGASHS